LSGGKMLSVSHLLPFQAGLQAQLEATEELTPARHLPFKEQSLSFLHG